MARPSVNADFAAVQQPGRLVGRQRRPRRESRRAANRAPWQRRSDGDARGDHDRAVDGGDDRAQRRDAQSHPEFVGGLGDGGRRARPLLGDAGQDDVAGDGEGQAEPDADDEQRDARAADTASTGVNSVSDAARRPSRHRPASSPAVSTARVRAVAHGDACEHAEHRRCHAPQAVPPDRPSTGRSRAPAGSTATGRTPDPDRPSTDSRLADDHAGERRIAEQPDVDERSRQAQLAPDEQTSAPPRR